MIISYCRGCGKIGKLVVWFDCKQRYAANFYLGSLFPKRYRKRLRRTGWYRSGARGTVIRNGWSGLLWRKQARAACWKCKCGAERQCGQTDGKVFHCVMPPFWSCSAWQQNGMQNRPKPNAPGVFAVFILPWQFQKVNGASCRVFLSQLILQFSKDKNI